MRGWRSGNNKPEVGPRQKFHWQNLLEFTLRDLFFIFCVQLFPLQYVITRVMWLCQSKMEKVWYFAAKFARLIGHSKVRPLWMNFTSPRLCVYIMSKRFIQNFELSNITRIAILLVFVTFKKIRKCRVWTREFHTRLNRIPLDTIFIS